MALRQAFVAAASCFILASGLAPDKHRPGHTYTAHEAVHITVNKVGPFNNPHETYRYYSLPFCRMHESLSPESEVLAGGQKHKQALTENIAGDRKETSPYDVTFGDQVPWRQLCDVTLTPDQVKAFKEAVHQDYFFEFFVEDLPMWGYVGEIVGEDLLLGELEGSRTYLFPHLHFKLGVHNDNIVSASVYTQSHRRVDITDASQPTQVQFSYSVEWVNEIKLKHANRMSRYVDSAFLPSSLEIHWLSIINSFVLVLLLTTFLTVILVRVLKNDLSRYTLDEEEGEEEEETGWKLIHGDVFRFPENKMLFCACQGAGAQLGVATALLLGCALAGVISTTKRGSLLTGMIVLYTLTSPIGGYCSASLYRQMNGPQWAHNIVLTSLLFPTPLFAIFLWTNSVAASRGSTAALPAGTIFVIGSLLLFLAFPLTVLGGIVGRNRSREFDAPTRTKKLAREIPTDYPFHRSPLFQMLLSGFLPFSAIYIELHYIFASVWGHKIYTLFGILVLAFAMLLCVTSFITVSTIYFQLAREDHKWWWRSFLNGGASGAFIYAYSFFYFHGKSSMGGFLQGSFFFGYMAVVSFAATLMLGSVGFYSSCFFVKYIYSRVKCD
mmetsp:Transcript_26860/g.56115  ORF Transcript_26860/g.56115 Transcript_26860/m.56115 type:complete len:609 (+) Transcript_26860:9-1835(+)